MRKYYLIFLIIYWVNFNAQSTYGPLSITKTYSQNGKYFIESIPFDGYFPSLRGKASVFENNKFKYRIERPFVRLGTGAFLAISNDGEYIIYILSKKTNSQEDELKNVTIYRNGKLVKTYSIEEFTNCNPQNEECNLLYDKFEEIIDYEKSEFNDTKNIIVFKDSVSAEELFLCKNSAFILNDTIYSTNSNRITTVFDLKNLKIVEKTEFSKIYPNLKLKDYKLKGESKTIRSPQLSSYIPNVLDGQKTTPNLLDGQKTALALADKCGLRAVYMTDHENGYHYFDIKINCYIDKKGKMEILKLEVDKKLPYDKIKKFFEENTYDLSLPEEFDKFYCEYFFWHFRNANNDIALLDTEEYNRERIIEDERNKTADTINNKYIPKNLKECLTELDKELTNKDKNYIKKLDNKSSNLNSHGNSLGTWIRNNWRLNGGSRLSIYFNERGIENSESMSGDIIYAYKKWLGEEKDISEKWENENPKIKTINSH